MTVCPLERTCPVRVGSAPPRWAAGVSFTRARQTAGEGEPDLATCQGGALADTYLRALGEQVGPRAGAKAGGGQLSSPAPAAPVAPSATGVEGAPRPRGGEADQEARWGTRAR